eukprot:TRINITY_DN6681_c0_g1_i2.p1 TRINITY_DN6681_c0_g1~~TRINITY_DN6681_c0_g1_i2.p1  ORF type:complete len:577 (-),score=157.77 TRINITY_DN6681_c0_g1_i2:183-1913(-)
MSLVYRLKKVNFYQRTAYIMMQAENGPCPLLAMANVLLLHRKFSLSSGAISAGNVTFEELASNLAGLLLESRCENPEMQRNLEQNVADAVDSLSSLSVGLDVNVRFLTVTDFEYTKESIVFDLLGIDLVHGWLIDPQDTETARVIGTQSYNHLVEKLIECKTAVAPPPLPESPAPAEACEVSDQLTEAQDTDQLTEAQDTDQLTVTETQDTDQSTVREAQDTDQLTVTETQDTDQSTVREAQDTDQPTVIEAQDTDQPTGTETQDTEAGAPSTNVQSGEASASIEEPAKAEEVVQTASVESNVSTVDSTLQLHLADDPEPEMGLPLEQEPSSEEPAAPEQGSTQGTGEGGMPTREQFLELSAEEQRQVVEELRQRKAARATEDCAEAETAAPKVVHDVEALKQLHRTHSELVEDGLVRESFLETSSSQLTYYGISELHRFVKEGSSCVFFRNNHFSVLHKHKDRLFVLVTDEGYTYQPNIVWEELVEVEGDSDFFTSLFVHYVPGAPAPAADTSADEELAKKLQQDYENENQRLEEQAAGQKQQQQQQQRETARRTQAVKDKKKKEEKDKDSCSIC